MTSVRASTQLMGAETFLDFGGVEFWRDSLENPNLSRALIEQSEGLALACLSTLTSRYGAAPQVSLIGRIARNSRVNK